MSSTRWISRFRRHLLRSGLPSSYILRVCSEFIDHLNDLGLGRSCEHALEFPRGNEILQVRVRVNQLGHWLSLR